MQSLFDPLSYTYSAYSAPIAMVAILAIGVGVWVVFREKGRRIAWSFLVSTLPVAVYLGGFALMVRSATPDVALFWGRVAYLGVPFIVPAIYQFTIDLLGIRERRRGLVRVAWLLGVVYVVLAVGTDILVAGVLRMDWGYITRLTLWHVPVIAWQTCLFVLAIRDYVLVYRDADPIQRARIRWFAIPMVIASAAFIDYGPSFELGGAPWGFVFFSVFLLSAAWAVGRYHLPDLTAAFAADQILATMAEPLFVCDDRGNVAIVNPAACCLLEREEQELLGRPLREFFGSQPAAELLQAEAAVSGRELDVYTREGKAVAVAVTSRALRERVGRRVGTVVVARDVRERKRVAQELERRKEHFQALIENARDTITILDREGRIMYESPSTLDLIGYAPEDQQGRPVFFRIHPDDQEVVRAAFLDLVERPGGTAEIETRVIHADQSTRVFEYRGTNLLSHPAVRGIVVNGRDVTEERHLAAQLQQAQKMEAIGRLAGGVAHDFNNILTAIQGHVALMREEIPVDGPLGAELEEIGRGADRASRLTDQLLAFSRRQVIRPEVLDLKAVVSDLLAMLQRLIGESVDLVTETDDDVGAIRADRGQLEQILLNLVVNARDAVQGEGRVVIRTADVHVDAGMADDVEFHVETGPYVRLTVADNGVGMDAATRNRIFEPFFTTKGPGKGTGLGLSTVYGSVRQASGFIRLETAPGRGTRFHIYLPRVAGAVERDDGASTDAPEVEGGAGELILVVEDEAPVRKLMARVLSRRGYTVLEAESGADAIERVAAHGQPLDLLVADLVMPGMSGREVAERLTADQPGLRTIFVSGYTADEVVRQGIVEGHHVFLPKPFTPALLTATVAEALAGRPPIPSLPG
jgi:two-component system cell cycle sensor histidine kinase/response regulator CckA